MVTVMFINVLFLVVIPLTFHTVMLINENLLLLNVMSSDYKKGRGDLNEGY